MELKIVTDERRARRNHRRLRPRQVTTHAPKATFTTPRNPITSNPSPNRPCQSPIVARDPFTGVQIRIGVMGSAGGDLGPPVAEICRRLGRAIAVRGCCLLTGACPGIPHEVVLAAQRAGGHVVGISPASSLKEHVETYESPHREYDVLIFTGLGLMGRELVNIHSSDIVIVVSGRSGTLGEFAIAYEEGKLIGVLTGTGGITAALPALEASLNKQTGSEVMYESDPETLVVRLLERYVSGGYKCPCYPSTAGSTSRRDAARS